MQERDAGQQALSNAQLDARVHAVAESLSPIDLNRRVLSRVASWSAKDNKPISLGELVASRMPQQAARLGIEPYTGEEPVKKVSELNEDELKQVISEFYTQVSGVLAIGPRTYSAQEILEAIQSGTAIGTRMINAQKREMGLMEHMFESGKVVRIVDEAPKPIKIPDFQF